MPESVVAQFNSTPGFADKEGSTVVYRSLVITHTTLYQFKSLILLELRQAKYIDTILHYYSEHGKIVIQHLNIKILCLYASGSIR